jgi:hypothetical protein
LEVKQKHPTPLVVVELFAILVDVHLIERLVPAVDQLVFYLKELVFKQVRQRLAFSVEIPQLDFVFIVYTELVVIFIQNHVIWLIQCLELEN